MLEADFYVKYPFFSVKGWLCFKFITLLVEARDGNAEARNVRISIGSIMAEYSCFMDLL